MYFKSLIGHDIKITKEKSPFFYKAWASKEENNFNLKGTILLTTKSSTNKSLAYFPVHFVWGKY